LALREFVTSIKRHGETDSVGESQLEHAVSGLPAGPNELSANFALIFKQLFCVAAQRLANHLHEPLERLGVLFEEPLDTGTIHVSALANGIDGGASSGRYQSIEGESSAGPQMFARGKYLFLNRQLTKDEAAKLASVGYRFASVGQVAELLARNLQIERTTAVARFERMRLSVSADRLPPPGVHLACFIVRPSVYEGFEILVPATTQSRLPFSTIRSDDLTQLQIQQLRGLENLTINEILRVLVDSSSSLQFDEEFRRQLYNSFVKLVDVVGDPHLTKGAKFSAKEFQIPCRPSLHPASPGSCTLLLVRLLCNIHTSPTKQNLTYVPLSLFSAQQQLESDDPSDKSFSRKLKMEFGHKGTSKASIGTRVGSAETMVTMPKSPKPALLNFVKERLYPTRRSDEIMMVDGEKNMKDHGDVEMSVLETGMPETKADLTELMSAGSNKSNWVTEVFSLFQLEGEGRSSRRPGWK